jgi:predicted CoA-binding protein
VIGALIEEEADVVAIARGLSTVAVLGIKDADEPDAPAHSIPALLARTGVRVLGINPRVKHALGSPTLASIAELPPGVDVLDVFRRSEHIPAHTEELLALPPERRPAVVWLQSGIRHDASAARLAAAGYRVVQDRCLGVYRQRALRTR